MFCKHKWVKQSETILPAPAENLTEISYHGTGLRKLLEKTHILILSCEKCGEIYKSVEKG